jgi:hypothetical protein
MPYMTSAFDTLLAREPASTKEALAFFDSLDGVGLDFMTGRWHGAGFHTRHLMDGLLEHFNWYGKEFIDTDNVHPLLLMDAQKNVFSINPSLVPFELGLRFSIPRNHLTKRLFLALKPLLETKKSQARIRMTEYRGKVSATMIYDHLAINDIFRKIDDNTLFCVMDLKDVTQPFFFILRRDTPQ